MSKVKSIRKFVTIECLECRDNILSKGVSRYLTSKNKRNTPNKLEISKYCKFCKKHTLHREVKK
jgi:large subunit ribosomal protein L33